MHSHSNLVPLEYAGDDADSGPGMATRLGRLHTAQLSGRPHELYEAWCDAGRGWVEMGALDAAEAHFEQALRWAPLLGSADAPVEVLCELAELTAVAAERLEREERGRGRAQRRRAHAYAQRAAELAAGVSCPAWEIGVLLRVSDVLDRCGRREEALELQVRAVALMAQQTPA